MSNITTRERPGVYSRYDASSILGGGSGVKGVGVVAAATTGTALTPTIITNYDTGAELYGAASENCPMTELLRLLFLNGASTVVAVPAKIGAAADDDDFEDALAVLKEQEEVDIIICGSDDADVIALVKETVMSSDIPMDDRIGVVGLSTSVVQNCVTQAGTLNCERMVITAPRPVNAAGTAISGFYLAAAVAGIIASESDPAVPLNGAPVMGLYGLEKRYGEGDIDTLVRGGVTPVETAAGNMTVIRGVTTRTTTGGVADKTWRELTTVMIVDDVIPSLRSSLRARFARAKNTAMTRDAIRSRVIMELEDKKNREIIDGYDSVTVTADTDDSTVCVVEFGFTVAHGLNQIHVSAHITV